MAWSFEIPTALRCSLDLSGLDPDAFSSVRELLGFAVWQGRDRVPLGDLLRAAPSPDGIERWSGDLRLVDGLGAGNRNRRIEVRGSPGHRVGAGMSGGTLRVEGDVGHDLGMGLEGGTIVVTGSCGARAGGFSPGFSRGMRGGMILIGGDAGPEAGQKMRRGLLAIAGTAGPGAGHALIAGTLIAGRLEGPFGLGLKRGTIISATRPRVPAWFGPAVAVELSVTRILSKFLAPELGGRDWFPFLRQTAWLRAQGDRLAQSQGELLLPPE